MQEALATATAALDGAEDRPGQREMAGLVEQAISSGRHLVVQAGTGTGKTLAYVIPALTSGKRIVVATATKALQDQLANKDLPFLAEHLDVDFDWAVLKGRSNYVCLQRLREMANPDQANSSSTRWRSRHRPRSRRSPTGPDRRDDRRPGGARLVAVGQRVAGGQRRQRRVPGRQPLPAR